MNALGLSDEQYDDVLAFCDDLIARGVGPIDAVFQVAVRFGVDRSRAREFLRHTREWLAEQDDIPTKARLAIARRKADFVLELALRTGELRDATSALRERVKIDLVEGAPKPGSSQDIDLEKAERLHQERLDFLRGLENGPGSHAERADELPPAPGTPKAPAAANRS